MLTNSVS